MYYLPPPPPLPPTHTRIAKKDQNVTTSPERTRVSSVHVSYIPYVSYVFLQNVGNNIKRGKNMKIKIT